MTPRRGRPRPATRSLGNGLGLVLGCVALLGGWASAGAQAGKPARAPAIYHKSRGFRIPFKVDPADVPTLKEVQLWVSEDSGFTWKPVSRSSPDRPSFVFRATRDAEYWFAVRTLDLKGVIYPREDEAVEPSMKVIVDTAPPSLVLASDGRRGGLAAVRWEARDANLDLSTLILEYQVEGGRDWRQVPIQRLALIGTQSWDAGTAEPLKVRGSVTDKAGNVTEVAIRLEQGTPANPASGLDDDLAEYSAPPPVAPVSTRPSLSGRDRPSADGFVTPPPSFYDSAGGEAATPAPVAASPSGPEGGPPRDGFEGAPMAPTAEAAPEAAPGGPEGKQTLLVSSPQFPLYYEVEGAGPEGPAVVELWVTQDGGRTWFRRGEDPDKVSPFPVDLGGEGTFGLRTVARSASGLGDQAPAPGDPPLIWIEVDARPPVIKLFPPVVGQGKDVGKIAVYWQASDLNLGKEPVTLSWRPVDSPTDWRPITEAPIENKGKFIWTVPESVPPRFHVRIEVVDNAGNRASAETSQGPAILVDRARPRSKILGLGPSALGGNAAPRPLR